MQFRLSGTWFYKNSNNFISEIPFIFVRTKIDKTASEDKRKFPRTFCERRVVKQVRDRCEESITGAKLPQSKTFVISTVYPDKWDFRALVQGKHYKNIPPFQ